MPSTFVLLLFSAISVACQATLPSQTPPAYVFPTSRPGFGTLHGQLVLVNPVNVAPEHDGIYLVPIEQSVTDESTVNAVVLDSVPRAFVDETSGEFVVPNVPPGHYLVMVVAQSNTRLLARQMDSSQLAIAIVNESDVNKKVEMGFVRVP